MHYLQYLAREIDKTHAHLGNLAAVEMLSIKAKKLLLVISPRGCGKSRVSSYIGLSVAGASVQDRISVAGLQYLKEEFNGFQSVLVVDDIAKTQTPYARIATITTIAELVYSHYCKSALAGTFYSIENFYGSAIINIQPVLLKEIVRSDEWEASIQDKSLRYYHLYRPQQPNPAPPKVKLQWGIELNKVKDFDMTGKLISHLKSLLATQWGVSRVREHILDLAKACAAIDGRDKVSQSDLLLLIKLLRPLSFERLVSSKSSFESGRELNSDLLAILTEYVTYGNFTLQQLSLDYKLSTSQCYKIMSRYSSQWVEVAKSPTTYAPGPDFKVELKRLGLNSTGR